MIKKVRRGILKNLFINIQKEETWLNDMCQSGYSLCEISNGYYVFEPCDPGTYIYRLEFFDQEIFQKEKDSYLKFMQESNVECIASFNSWHYFRRDSALGNFEIYSDIDSKIDHYKRINFIWCMLALISIASGLSQNVFFGSISQFDLILNIILIIIGLFFLTLTFPLTRKINSLKREKTVYK